MISDKTGYAVNIPERKGYQVEVPEMKKSKDLEADVVVIGGGGAGLPAALTALEGGAKRVIVLEKRFATGGNGLRCNHIFAVGSRLQKEVGSTLSKDEFVNRNLEYHHCDRVKPDIIRALVYKTADTIGWLEKQGTEFKLLVSHFPGSDPKTCTTHVEKSMPEPDSLCSLGKMFRNLTQKSADAGVQFLLRAGGKRILRGAKGEVTAVVAQTRDGQEIEIKTKAVILCTGDFAGNKELLKKWFPEDYIDGYVGDGLMTNTGDGIPIAEEAGAALSDYLTLMGHAGSPPTVVNNQHVNVSPAAMRVNKNGQRFFAENFMTVLNKLQRNQPGKIAYNLFDDNIVQSMVEQPSRPPQHPRIPTPPEKWIDVRQYIQKYARREEWVKMADTWDEIADWMGCDRKDLKAAIDRYNSLCDQGYDEDFNKDKQYMVPLRTSPYYAILSGVNMGGVLGGPVRVNEGMEVLGEQDNKPIPGFYAAGAITSGWTSCGYTAPGMAGSALSFSMTSGRIAGENAAKYALGK